MEQLITPNPNISCTPGYCLQYVRQTFNAPAVYATALDDWNAGQYNHTDQNWPALWFPIFFSVVGEPAGHVALHAPDHSIYSSSSPTSTTPVHHASLSAMQFYWNNGKMLTYLGWSETIENVKVIKEEDTVAIILDADNWYARVAKTVLISEGRDFPREEFEGWVGQDFIHLAEATEDSANATQRMSDANLGVQARTEDWQGKITTLETTNQDLQNQLTAKPIETTPEPVVTPSEPSVTPEPAVVPSSTKSTSLWDEIKLLFKGFFK